MDIENMVKGLENSDNKYAYQCLRQLEEESSRSSDVFKYIDSYLKFLDNENSYIRTRGIVLIAANAKWDKERKIDNQINRLLSHIADDKPITARQCIKALPIIVKHKPYLKDSIVSALLTANPIKYSESMQKLVLQDIQKVLNEIKKLQL